MRDVTLKAATAVALGAAVLCGGLVFNVATSASAHAGLLDAATCASLRKQRQAMIAQGLQEIFERGPDWAKTQGKQAAFPQVRAYIAVEEKVLFRCLGPLEMHDEMVRLGLAPPLPPMHPRRKAEAEAEDVNADRRP
ncbi:MAG: hypothetical protein AAFR04_10035 [Pseudomonadota bacterium]